MTLEVAAHGQQAGIIGMLGGGMRGLIRSLANRPHRRFARGSR
jgi:hypothetical protein